MKKSSSNHPPKPKTSSSFNCLQRNLTFNIIGQKTGQKLRAVGLNRDKTKL